MVRLPWAARLCARPHVVTVRTSFRASRSRGDPAIIWGMQTLLFFRRVRSPQAWPSPPPFTLSRAVENRNRNSPVWQESENTFLSTSLDPKRIELEQACILFLSYEPLFSVGRCSDSEEREAASRFTCGTSKLVELSLPLPVPPSTSNT